MTYEVSTAGSTRDVQIATCESGRVVCPAVAVTAEREALKLHECGCARSAVLG